MRWRRLTRRAGDEPGHQAEELENGEQLRQGADAVRQ